MRKTTQSRDVRLKPQFPSNPATLGGPGRACSAGGTFTLHRTSTGWSLHCLQPVPPTTASAGQRPPPACPFPRGFAWHWAAGHWLGAVQCLLWLPAASQLHRSCHCGECLQPLHPSRHSLRVLSLKSSPLTQGDQGSGTPYSREVELGTGTPGLRMKAVWRMKADPLKPGRGSH